MKKKQKRLFAALLAALVLIGTCVGTCSCDKQKQPDTTKAPEVTIGEITEGHVTQPSGFNPETDLTQISVIEASRDDTVGITWYFDNSIVRTLKDNIIYLYIGVYDSGRVSFRLRAQNFGEEKLALDRFRITIGGEQYELKEVVNDGDNGTYYWEWMDFIPGNSELETVRAMAKADTDIKVRAYGGDSFKERTVDETELKALRNMLFIYESIIGSEITYPVDLVQVPETIDTAISGTETEAPVYDNFRDNISIDGNIAVLNYYDYSISFPSSYYCGKDADSGAVRISASEGDAEKIELLYTEGEFKAESVTDDVVANTLKLLQARLPDAVVSIYTGSTQLTLGGRPAVRYAYKMEFETVTVYVTQYLVEYSDGCYSIAAAELVPGGEIFATILNTLEFRTTDEQ